MLKRSATTAIVALSVPLLGGAAIALANSVDTTPAPVSVSHSSLDDHGGLTGGGGVDDPAGHDVDDDHGGLTGGGGVDDPAGHDVDDDHGGLTGGDGSGSSSSGSDSSGSDSSGSGHHGSDD